MAINDVRAQYDEARNRLFELMQERRALLRRLAHMSMTAADITPATGMLVEFDCEQARHLLNQVEGMTSEIAAALVQANRQARKCGQPQIRWIKLDGEKK